MGVVTNQYYPKNREKRRLRVRRDRGKSVMGRGGICPCHLHPLNITVIHDIFHHGYPIIYHDKPYPNTFVVSSINIPVQSVCWSLRYLPGFIHPTSSTPES